MTNKEKNLITIGEGKYYYACYDANADPFDVLQGTPSYFLINKGTGRIEAMVASSVSALGLLPQMDKATDEVLSGETTEPVDLDSLPESKPH